MVELLQNKLAKIREKKDKLYFELRVLEENEKLLNELHNEILSGKEKEIVAQNEVEAVTVSTNEYTAY